MDPLVVEVLEALRSPFYAAAAALVVPARGRGTLKLTCLPFAPGAYACTVMLRHERLGEFAVAVQADVALPTASRAPPMTVTPEAGVVGSMQRELRVPSKNVALAAAVTALVERYQGDARTKARAALAKYCSLAAFSEQSTATAAATASTDSLAGAAAAAVPFSIRIDSPFLQPLRDEILILPDEPPSAAAAAAKNGSGSSAAAAAAAAAAHRAVAALPKAVELCAPGSSGGASLATNVALLAFAPTAAGAYPCTAVVACASPWMTDVRCYELRAVVTPPSVVTELLFRCPAGQKIVQQVPVHNSSDVDWLLIAQPRPPPPFGGPPSIKIPARGSALYPISYAPLQPTPPPPQPLPPTSSENFNFDFNKDVPPLDLAGAPWSRAATPAAAAAAAAAVALECGDTVKLVLCDEKSLGKPVTVEFVLRGAAEEPLAEEHRVIACAARQSATARFPVRNAFPRAITYRAETDLPGVSGAATLSVPAHGEGFYDLVVCPPFGGTFTGSLTFTPLPPQATRASVAVGGGGAGAGGGVGLEGCAVWYTIEVQAASPQEEDTIEVRTPLRTALGVEISLTNPFSEQLDFEVVLQGEGVMGEPAFALQPLESATYTVYYAPLREGSFEGSVTFANARVGEFWYKLQLEAEEAQPVTLPPLSAPVGASACVTVDIENPTGQVVMLEASVSNRRNFAVTPPTLTLAPFASATAAVTYTPSSIGEPETADIILRPVGKHPPLGDWAYSASGTGALPGVMDEHRPVSAVGEVASYTFAFRNPFAHPLLVDVVLREGADASSTAAAAAAVASSPLLPASRDNGGGGGGGGGGAARFKRPASSDAGYDAAAAASPRERAAAAAESAAAAASPLTLLLKKTASVVLGPFASLQLPLAFAPTVIADTVACLEVRGQPARGTGSAARALTWVFPIRGVAEAPVVPRAFSLTTAAKTSMRRDVEVVLRGLTEVIGQETFEYQLVLPPLPAETAPQQQAATAGRVGGAAEAASAAAAAAATGLRLAERALTVAALHTTITHARQPLLFQLSFEPLRPFTAAAELVVIRRSGGRWRFGISLIATDAAPDDSFEIQAPVGGAASVSLRLCNRYLGYALFQAYFTPDSSLSLSVEPSDGVLAPFGTEGTQLTVTYAPKQYSPGQRGRLVVCTDDVQWSYEVSGVFPNVKSVAHVTSKVDSNKGGGLTGRRGGGGGGGGSLRGASTRP